MLNEKRDEESLFRKENRQRTGANFLKLVLFEAFSQLVSR